jgi:hypothetical protein
MPISLFAGESSPPDALGDALKVVQICFYALGMTLAILTYRAAVRGWLTPTNTEYQKRVMDRLAKLSEDLYSEFDESSDHYWPNLRPVHAAIEEMNQTFKRNKDEVLAARTWYYGTPTPKDIHRLHRLLRPILSDPFIPENIRAAVVDLLESRLEVLQEVYVKEFERYSDNLAKGKHPPLTDLDDVNRIHNRVVDQLNKQGCGIRSIENAIHDVRGLIQDYFDSFNPHGVGKGRRKKFEEPPASHP